MAVSSSRRRARLLAPLALLVALAATVAIVASSPHGDAVSSAAAAKDPRPRIPYRYTVRAGDTLSAIAVRYQVSVEDLQRLNPSLDSFTLQPGVRVKLRVMRR